MADKKTTYASLEHSRRDTIQAVIMVTPSLLGFIILVYFPIIYILQYALFNYNGWEKSFAGFANFVRLFTRDPDYWVSVGTTFILAFGKLAVEIPLALFLAVLLSKKITGAGFFRVALFLPAIISTAIVGLIFTLMFGAYDGIINVILADLHLIKEHVNWFGNKWTALTMLGTASVWQNAGVNMIFFMVALQQIPQELYECASIDGVPPLRVFVSITLPMIGKMFQIILLMAIIGSLKVADLVLASTNGQPGGATEVVMTYIFKYFFGHSGRIIQIGYASAMSVITGLILAVVSVIYLNATKKMRD